MVEKRRDGGKDALLAFGVGGGAFLGNLLAGLLQARPAEAATDTEKLNYMTQLMEAMVKGEAAILAALTEIASELAALGPGGFPLSILTPWVAQEPVEILYLEIRNIGVFNANQMVDFRRGKRMALRIENSHDQPLACQAFGNFTPNVAQATLIGAAVPCVAGGNANIGIAGDDWQPFIGIRITTAIAPVTGGVRVWSCIQE